MPQKFVNHTAIRRGARAGWTMPEAVAALAITAALIACLALSTREGRRQASLGDNFANLKQFAFGYGAYAADHDDRVCTFSWRAGVLYPGFSIASSDFDAAGHQAVEIIRRRADRPDFPTVTSWFVGLLYSHLVLVDYLDLPLPQRFVAAPGDRQRLRWQDAIQTGLQSYVALSPTERPPYNNAGDSRWAYSTSYEMPPAFYAPDARSLSPSSQTFAQGSGHHLFTTGSSATPSGRRRLSEVQHPGAKVILFEQYQRHFGPTHVYFAYPSARVPALLVDGSTRILHTGSTNLGFQPNAPLSTAPTSFWYVPNVWEPPTLSGNPNGDSVFGHYRWTRSGLRGRDWGGTEVRWVD